jgi:transposase
MREDLIEMTRRELERWQVIQKVMLGELTQAEGGEILGLCERQVRRLVKKGRKKGVWGLIHGSRGKESPRKMAEELEERIVAIIRTKYPDFSPLHATEKLGERHRIEVSREKVRQVMIAHGLWKRRRVRKEVHIWRERKHHVGEMVQMDGSHHAWLEDRGPRLVLMGYVDDATGRFYGRFYDHTYKTTRQADTDELLRDVQAETQFERALSELGIQVIHAHSPQAKGRVERVFKTLQDRLVKEMRLARIKSLEEANKFLDGYLETFNRRFMREALEPGDLHRSLPKSVILEDVLCIKGLRTINEGYVVKWRGRTLVLERQSLTVRRQKVKVLDRFDGCLSLKFNGRDLAYHEGQEPRPVEPKPVMVKPRRKPPKYYPPATHPWRRRFLESAP